MIVKLSLSVTFHPGTGWASIHCESYALDFAAEDPKRVREWSKDVECLPDADVPACARGALSQALMKYSSTAAWATPF